MRFAKHPLSLFAIALLTVFANVLGAEYNFSARNFLYAIPNISHTMAVFGLYFLYRKALQEDTKYKGFLNTAAFFSAVLSILYHIHNFDTKGYFLNIGLGQLLVLGFIFGCNAVFFYALYKLLLQKTETLLVKDSAQKKPFSFHFFVFLLLGLPSYIAMFPAAIQWDNGTMLQMAYGLQPLSLDNPLFHTGLMYLLRLVAELSNATFALALYTLVQHVLLALLFAMLAQRLQNPHKGLVWLLYALYALHPAFGNYASSLGKDLPFAMAILYLSLWIYDAMVEGEYFLDSYKNYAKLFLAGFLLSLLRNVGQYLFLLSLSPLVILLFFKNKSALWKTVLASLLSIGLAFGLLTLSANALQAKAEKKGANKSIPMQQIARVISLHGKEALTDLEYNSINAIMDIEQVPKKYLEGYSDHIKDLHKENCSKAELAAFSQAHKSLGKRYPKEYFDSLYLNVHAYFVPGIHTDLKPSYFYEYQYIEDIPNFKPRAHSSLQGIYRNLVALYRRLPLMDILLSTGMISYFHLLILFFVLYKKAFRYIPILVPSLLYMIGLLASPVNGYFRYSIPLLLCAGLSLIVFLRCLKDSQNS